MSTAFDHIAQTYDGDFTDSKIGRLQRGMVWGYLEQNFPGQRALNILEINCGTGEDAIFIAQSGHKVIATDISSAMIDICLDKSKEMDAAIKPEFRVCSFQKMGKMFTGQKFDLIFSNFGGLNCMDPMAVGKFRDDAADLLEENGHFIAVVMSGGCLWETIYFLIRGQKESALRRRRKGPVKASIGNGETMETWYYAPKEMRKIFSGHFEVASVRPVGFMVPPSYMEKYFSRKKNLLQWLSGFDDQIKRFGGLANFSDHFLIDFKKRTGK